MYGALLANNDKPIQFKNIGGKGKGKLSMDISIVIACHNSEAWIAKSLESACSQVFKGTYEIVVVDDGSTDSTMKIIDEFCVANNNVFCIRKLNTGLADSLNIGIERSRGKWIARLDADDIMRFDRIAVQYEYCEKNDLVLAGSSLRHIDINGNFLSIANYPNNTKKLKYHLEKHLRFFPHSSAFFKKDCFINAGRYNARFKKSQDRDLWLRIAPLGNLGCVSERLVDIRLHPGQVSNQTFGGESQAVFGVAATVCYYLRTLGEEDPSIGEEGQWLIFLRWLIGRLESSKYIEHRRAWNESRNRYYNSSNSSLIERYSVLLGMPYKLKYLKQKYIGYDEPRQLALDWVRTCAAS